MAICPCSVLRQLPLCSSVPTSAALPYRRSLGVGVRAIWSIGDSLMRHPMRQSGLKVLWDCSLTLDKSGKGSVVEGSATREGNARSSNNTDQLDLRDLVVRRIKRCGWLVVALSCITSFPGEANNTTPWRSLLIVAEYRLLRIFSLSHPSRCSSSQFGYC